MVYGLLSIIALKIKQGALEDRNLFARIFRENWDNFILEYPAYDIEQYHTPIKKMLNCGDPEYGHAAYLCENCLEIKKVAFSCKSSFCLSCSKVYTEKISNSIRKNIHDGLNYNHLILTVPKQFRVYFYRERHNNDLFTLFYRSV